MKTHRYNWRYAAIATIACMIGGLALVEVSDDLARKETPLPRCGPTIDGDLVVGKGTQEEWQRAREQYEKCMSDPAAKYVPGRGFEK